MSSQKRNIYHLFAELERIRDGHDQSERLTPISYSRSHWLDNSDHHVSKRMRNSGHCVPQRNDVLSSGRSSIIPNRGPTRYPTHNSWNHSRCDDRYRRDIDRTRSSTCSEVKGSCGAGRLSVTATDEEIMKLAIQDGLDEGRIPVHCSVCDIRLSGFQPLRQHLNSNKHIEKLH